jgi:hypothetical protein
MNFLRKESEFTMMDFMVFENERQLVKVVWYMGSAVMAIVRIDGQLKLILFKLGNWMLLDLFRKYLHGVNILEIDTT